MFTTAYLNEKEECILKTFDTVKMSISEGYCSEHRLFPPIERVGEIYHGGKSMVMLKMEYFPRVTSIKNNVSPRQWRLYKALRDVFRAVMMERGRWEYMDLLYDTFRKMPSEFANEKEALVEMVDQLRNYMTFVGFEISPRNVAVKGGKLVLLDCFFDMDLLAKTRR